ncbi:unnamed protein product [Adineta steineri]|uniref:Uncharacterized protein n=1 Tax=Adineta steineri TaxID=433720 RepID=A0A818PCZ5_9BILA|nr:unnamed protein product [Adineta steineri]
MKVEYTRLLIVLVCLIIKCVDVNGSLKREQCRDFAGDLSNCQRFIRCFYNLRVLFTCASGTAYVPELQTCVGKELVDDCNDSKNRIEITVNSNSTPGETDDYPTIEADLNALEIPLQKSLSSDFGLTVTPKQFGCSSYCYNEGICVLVGQRITCRCPSGFIGVRCQVTQAAISTRATCNPNPCDNGGICVTAPGLSTNFERCDCLAGWTGFLCDNPPDNTGVVIPVAPVGGACPSNHCLNGATCVTTQGGGFRCFCVAGFTGVLCDISTGAAVIGTGCSTTNPCSNAGVCVPTGTSYQCQCAGGFSGTNCQSNSALALRNLCQPNPCRNGGSCYLNQTNFACACPTGFGGTCCELTLAATNPCFNNPCLNSGTCQIAGINTYRCICPTGLVGTRCEQRMCDPNPCLYGGVCLPYGDSFLCQCPPQYTGRCCELLLVTTAAPNPCTVNPCLNGGTCTATSVTEFTCSCTSSYYGRCCELRNFCQPNPCYNGGACIPTTNAYVCSCVYPNSGSNCELRIATPAPQSSCACILCPCPTPTTTTTNPCLPNPCQNNGGCAVTQNTAQCYCPSAFTGYYCQYTRKRTLSTAPCSNLTCLNGGECYMSDQGPQCTCPKPYFGEHCELMNRPRSCDPNPCGQSGQCISTKDGYKCICKNGMTGILCEQVIMPNDYRWCPLNCQAGTSCVYEGTIPKCRVLSVYKH